MSQDRFPVGQEMSVVYPQFTAKLQLHSLTELRFEIEDGPFARSETVTIDVVALGNGVFVVSWLEASGATVVNVQHYDRGMVYAFATLADGQVMRMTGRIEITRPAAHASDARPERNKALVLEAMTALFQRHDAAAVDRLYAHDYIQHNLHIPQGRDALRSLVAGLDPAVHYEPGLIVADGSMVAIHGRIRGWAPVPQVVVDLFRVENGRLAEHWDVLQDEVRVSQTSDAVAMFDPEESVRQAEFA